MFAKTKQGEKNLPKPAVWHLFLIKCPQIFFVSKSIHSDSPILPLSQSELLLKLFFYGEHEKKKWREKPRLLYKWVESTPRSWLCLEPNHAQPLFLSTPLAFHAVLKQSLLSSDREGMSTSTEAIGRKCLTTPTKDSQHISEETAKETWEFPKSIWGNRATNPTDLCGLII